MVGWWGERSWKGGMGKGVCKGEEEGSRGDLDSGGRVVGREAWSGGKGKGACKASCTTCTCLTPGPSTQVRHYTFPHSPVHTHTDTGELT